MPINDPTQNAEYALKLKVVPLTLKEANDYVSEHHRHHKPAVGHRFSIGVVDQDRTLHGVAIMGRPVARMTDWRTTVEVVRVATDGTPNACSMLYGAARSVAKHMGFERIITFTLDSEPGTSLRAAGWVMTGVTEGGEWGRPSRAREVVAPHGAEETMGSSVSEGGVTPAAGRVGNHGERVTPQDRGPAAGTHIDGDGCA